MPKQDWIEKSYSDTHATANHHWNNIQEINGKKPGLLKRLQR